MTRIPVAISRFPRKKFKRHYLKKKKFFPIFIPFLKCAWNLEHFQKKDEYPSLIIFEIIESARGGVLNV